MNVTPDYGLPSLLPLVHLNLSHTMEEIDEDDRRLAHFKMDSDDDSAVAIAEDKLSASHSWSVRRSGAPNSYTYAISDSWGRITNEITISPNKILGFWFLSQRQKKKQIKIYTTHEISRESSDNSSTTNHYYEVFDQVSPLFPTEWVLHCWQRLYRAIHRTVRLIRMQAPPTILASSHDVVISAIQDIAKVIPEAKTYEATTDYRKVESDIKTMVLSHLPPEAHKKLKNENAPYEILRERVHIEHVFLNNNSRASKSVLKFVTSAEIMYRPKLVLSFLRYHLNDRINPIRTPKAIKTNTHGKLCVKQIEHTDRRDGDMTDMEPYLRSFVAAFEVYRPKLDELFDTFCQEEHDEKFVLVK